MTALSGVRISWLIEARKSVLARFARSASALAASATALASESAISATLRAVVSSVRPITREVRPEASASTRPMAVIQRMPPSLSGTRNSVV
ncbi:hypothetical protein BGCPKDLD_5211 [Methylorubrum suomiense]|uniref:Secreted protein n=1 Tax=Methylorubrum suomiense TaxID=144191 RepID=A0ABQ4V5F6_9HYPH|nr:hypothetical protein BGCPKDLD_5211 [Methylorubrum suomiense]